MESLETVCNDVGNAARLQNAAIGAARAGNQQDQADLVRTLLS